MPLYEYRCRMCDWKRERRAGLYVDAIPCEACGEIAFRNPINRFNITDPTKWGGDVLPGHDALRDEITGHIGEAAAAMETERANGWQEWRNLRS